MLNIALTFGIDSLARKYFRSATPRKLRAEFIDLITTAQTLGHL
jgi:hypothetical protein